MTVDENPEPPETRSGDGDEARLPGSESAASPNPANPFLEQLQAALADRDAHQQKWLRTEADLQNYRRRVQAEMEQERRFAVLPLARDLLPALDNLHRALEAARAAQDQSQLVQGVQMVAKQFDDILARHSVVAINATGKPFDPNLHQALQQIPAADKPPLTVLAECERGYLLHERVVRPSTVIVSAAVSAESKEN